MSISHLFTELYPPLILVTEKSKIPWTAVAEIPELPLDKLAVSEILVATKFFLLFLNSMLNVWALE